MDFSDRIKTLADRAQKVKGSLQTEEATKTALVMPFIQALGYDLFNPLEVVPEYVADVAGLKGEKVDYAIMQENKPIMIIECKSYGTNLNSINREQLHRYFLTLDSAIGILTDGIRYLFFSRADDGKNMDATPFMEFSLDNIDPTLLPELHKLRKGKFEIQNTLDAVAELKFNRQVKIALASNMDAPDLDFADYFLGRAGIKGIKTKIKEEKYIPYTKRAFNEFIAEQVDGRLKSALAATTRKEEEPPPPAPAAEVEINLITELEWQVLYIVKSILVGVIDSERIQIRNLSNTGRSSINIDKNQYKPLVVSEFNEPGKMTVQIILDSTAKNREKHTITKVDDILQHADKIRAACADYLAPKPPKAKEEAPPPENQ